MDVQLYVYDLSNGLARAFSPALLGIQIDAVWHTSIVLEGVEYVYDGGVKMVSPGKTHLGPPLKVLNLGKTDLPMEVTLEYVESMKSIYTFEAYDIFTHNCNNFSNDLSTFLLGHGIPEHITNLPATVLNTPFGRAIKPEIQRMVQRSQEQTGGLVGLRDDRSVVQDKISLVQEASSNVELDSMLDTAKKSCAIVFFTSQTCRPCITLYPLFDELAREAEHKAVLIKVDISRAFDVASKYSVRATPTFQTFMHGQRENRWSGSDPSQLRGNFEMLLRMTWPPHPHASLKLTALRNAEMRPVLYSKVPPLAKLKAKMGSSVSEDGSVQGVLNFVSTRSTACASDATLPDMKAFSRFLQTAPFTLEPEILFTVVDLLRVAMVDPRFSGYYAEEVDHKTIAPLISHINNLVECPYPLRIVTLQLGCNMFSTPLYPEHILGCETLSRPIIDLITSSLLDTEHANVRVAAASLAFNLAASNSICRTKQQRDILPSDLQIELAASLLEAIRDEKENAEAVKGYLLAFALVLYCLPAATSHADSNDDGGMVDLLESLDAREALKEKRKLFSSEKLLDEIADVLLPSLRKERNVDVTVPAGW